MHTYHWRPAAEIFRSWIFCAFCRKLRKYIYNNYFLWYYFTVEKQL